MGEGARPAVGAVVEAAWNLDESGQGTGRHRLTVRTGPDGRFVIPDVPEAAEVKLLAEHRGWRTPLSRSTHVSQAVILHLSQQSGVAMAGRVIGADGRPVADAIVHLRSATPPRSGGPGAR